MAELPESKGQPPALTAGGVGSGGPRTEAKPPPAGPPETATGPRRNHRGHDGEHRPAPPGHARRVAARRRPRRRGRQGPEAGDRLRPHRDRKVLRGQELLEGHPLRRADGLRLLLLPDGGLLRRGRAADRAGDPAAGQVPADDLPRAQPDPLPPGLAGDDGARPRRDLDALVLLPRARPHPRPLRDGDRAADAHALLPGRRRDRGHPARLRGEAARVHRRDAGAGRPVPGAARPQRGLPLAHQGRPGSSRASGCWSWA